MFKITFLSFLLSFSAFAVNPGEKAPSFSLVNQDNIKVDLSKINKDKIIVLEWFNTGCPYVRKHYDSGNMQASQALYKENSNVMWLLIASSAEGKQGHIANAKAAKEMLKQEKSHADHLLLDVGGKVGQAYGAKTTPQIVIIDQSGTVRYNGAIDSIASADKADIKKAKNYAVSAVSKLLLKNNPSPAKTRPYGCSVKY